LDNEAVFAIPPQPERTSSMADISATEVFLWSITLAKISSTAGALPVHVFLLSYHIQS
jgi:hypothetical protein